MALQIWLPLTGDTKNRGLFGDITMNASGAIPNSSGIIGTCYSFDGVDDYLNYTVPDKSWWGGKEMSYACWFKSDNTKTGGTLVELFSDLTVGYSYNSSGLRFSYWRCYTNGSGNRAGDNKSTSTYYSADKWHHVVGTFSHQYNRIYVDGVLSQEWDSSSLYTTNWTPLLPASYSNIAIGRSYGSSSYIGGLLNDVRIYDHCLSDKEVKEISKGLIMHYKLDDAYIENTVNALGTKSNNFVGIWSSYGFGSRGTITSANIEPAIDGQVALVTNNSSATTDTSSEMATGFNITGLQSGEKITCSAYVKGNGPTIGKRVRLHIYYNSACGATSTGSEFILTNEWKRESFTYTWNKPVSANSPNFYVVGYDKAGESFYVSNCQVEKKDHATPYTYIEREQSMTYDSSGYNKYGEIVGNLSVMNSAPKHEKSLYIEDGRYNYIRSSFMLPLYEATMSIWVKTNQTGYSNYHIPFASSQYYEISIAPSGVLRQGFTINGTRKVMDTSSKNVMDGQWHMLTATFDGTTIKRYVDGDEVSGSATSAPGVLSSGQRTVLIGTFTEDHTYGCNKCNLSDARMYGKALSAADVKELYNLGASIDNKGNVFAFEIKEN